jgi:leader peptidase (prepilin peptidase)/N-methyltransferase
MAPETLVGIGVAVFGLVLGSFLNVVIARLPERRSLWAPRSACPGCGTPIAWYDNVPLVSFAALRGRCRACATPIPWRYPLVEATTAALLGGAWLEFGPTLEFVVAAALLAALVAITAIDLRHQIIPDAITLPGIVAGVFANVATARVTWQDTALGIALGGGVFFAIIVVSRGGMGAGDMKLGAMLGAFLGWKIALFGLMVAVVVGGASAVALMALGVRGRKDAIPFGPFLATGGVAALFWGEGVVQWYVSGLGT